MSVNEFERLFFKCTNKIMTLPTNENFFSIFIVLLVFYLSNYLFIVPIYLLALIIVIKCLS